MTALVLLFSILVGSVLQVSLPAPAWLGHAQIPVLVGLVIYYAMVADRATMIIAALLAGLVDDTLGLMPLGYSSFCYCVAGMVCQEFRDVVMARQWTTHVFLGAASNFGIALVCFLLLTKDDLIQMSWHQIGFKLLGSICVGAVAVPIIFQLMTWLDKSVGNAKERKLMQSRGNPFDDELLRIRLVLVLMIAGFGLIGASLWRMQVAHGQKYENSQFKQSIRRVRMPGMRGRIFDRNGGILADNRPSYGVALFLEELRQPGAWSKTIDRVEALVKDLSGIIGLPPVITRADIQSHVRRRLFVPLLAWRDLDDQTLARMTEKAAALPGVDVYTEAVRFYPQKKMACHILGYVGRADPTQNEDEPYHYYMPEMVGKSGLEKTLDPILRGEAGGRLVRVDVSGYRRDDIGQREPKRGNDVMLALDARIQQLAEESLGSTPGAIVVMDPDNGDVLAMASMPGFDPNSFVPFIRAEDWAVLTSDELNPLLNRAVGGAYAPGSIFKPVTALAALGSGNTTPQSVFECPGYFQLGKAVFRCWQHAGHGPLDLRGGLANSCNVYFFHTGLAAGSDAIYHEATALGFGQKTGIGLDGEAAGLVPNDAWKRMNFHDAWRDGDTCNLSIGQGALTATPLQLAVMTAALANSGSVWKPRLLLGVREPGQEVFERRQPVLVNSMNWNPKHIQAVREGMREVVMSPTGTGRAMAVPGIVMAGKTGTAEFGPRDARKRRAWMIAFAPYDRPRYAVVMVVDEGVSGGVTAAPKMHHLMSGLLQEKAAELEAQG